VVLHPSLLHYDQLIDFCKQLYRDAALQKLAIVRVKDFYREELTICADWLCV
jgi:hypothetical protein